MVKPYTLAAIVKLLFAQGLEKKLIKFPDNLGRYSPDGMFVYQMFQPGFLAGHQVQEFHTIEVILKRGSRVQVEISGFRKEFVRQVVEVKTAISDHYFKK